jgi:hypothetical protein
MDYSNQNLKKFPEDISGSLNCSNNKLRYIPNNKIFDDLYFCKNRIKRLPYFSSLKNIGSTDNKIKDRSRWFSRTCYDNKYYSYLFKILNQS